MNNSNLQVQQVHSNETVIEKSYKIDLQMNSGLERSFRGKVLDENNKEFTLATERAAVNVAVITPYFRSCSSKSVSIDSNGIFTFKMPIINNSLPYVMEV